MDSVLIQVRLARRDAVERRERKIAAKRGPSVQDRQRQLIHFYEHYEELVETLCDAAQYGPTPKLERGYETQRAWVRENYAEIRPFVVSFLQVDAEDAEMGRQLTGKSTDAFEALVAADNLEQFLNADDGGMICRITRTREALTLYGEHLRKLAVRTA